MLVLMACASWENASAQRNERAVREQATKYLRLMQMIDAVYVDTVDPSSDAYAKGLQQGDTITAIDGIAVSTSEDLEMAKNQYKAGQMVELTVYRNGKYYVVSIQLMDAAGL